MPKAFTDLEKKIIRERLLEQGHRLFSAYGLKKTNIEELAEAAGISKGAFYIFYDSKETLFMDVVELAEVRFRQEILATIELPGPSPRARLYAVLKQAFSLWKKIPLLQFFTRGDYELLLRRVPAEIIQEHLKSDQAFIEELVMRCQKAGIPIQAEVEQVRGLLYTLFLTSLHSDDFGADNLMDSFDLLVELVAAYCLGEVGLMPGIDLRPT